MKRLAGLWTHLTSFANLVLAYRKARRGKGGKSDVARSGSSNLEHELLNLQRALLLGEYRPMTSRLFTIYERKPRSFPPLLFETGWCIMR